jgi:hypothetical protein
MKKDTKDLLDFITGDLILYLFFAFLIGSTIVIFLQAFLSFLDRL